MTIQILANQFKKISRAFLGRFKIEVDDEDASKKANSIFLSEMLTSISQMVPEIHRYVDLNVGKLDKSKTFINKVKNL